MKVLKDLKYLFSRDFKFFRAYCYGFPLRNPSHSDHDRKLSELVPKRKVDHAGRFPVATTKNTPLILTSLLFETILNLPSNEPTSVILPMPYPFTKIIIMMTHDLLQTVFCGRDDCEIGQIKSNKSNSQIISDVNSTWVISRHSIWWFPTNQILESQFYLIYKIFYHL